MVRYCLICKERQPIYNYQGLKAEYCSDCKKEDMIDVVSKKCVICKEKQPNFNYQGLKAEYCSGCKNSEMVNVISKKCVICKERQPIYNYQGLKAEYCSDCKNSEMVNVISKKCIICKERQPIYNYQGLKPEYCSDCKNSDMVDVNNKKCVICKEKQPNFNYQGLKSEYCSDCKKENMVDVNNKKCKNCNITMGNYNGYCSPCFYYLFPDNKKTKNYKVKQNIITDELKKYFNFDSYDKIIDNTCNKYRPDIFKDLLTHSLIIEIDEDKHNSYDDECEFNRLQTIYEGLAYRPMFVIRFNPDKYSQSNSIFTKELKIKKKEFSIRLEKLKNQIQYCFENIPKEQIVIYKLYYD